MTLPTHLYDRIMGLLLSKEITKSVSDSPDNSGLILIEGFEYHEVFFAVQELDENSTVKVRITDFFKEPAGEDPLDEGLFFSEQETLSYNRSMAKDNIRVVFVMSEQSDRSSLTAMLKKNDDNIIDCDRGTAKFDELIDSAWEKMVGLACLPSFKEEAKFYLESLLEQKAWDRPLLRPSTRFLSKALEEIVNEEVKSQRLINEALCQSLPELGMFIDPHAAGISKSAMASRLKENYYGSNLYRPDGSSEDKDKLDLILDKIVFKDPDNNDEDFDGSANVIWKSKCKDFLTDHPSDHNHHLEKIPWGVVSQIFSNKSRAKIKLGEEVRETLSHEAPDRIEEFDELSVEAGLDSGNPSAAEKIINSTDDGEEEESLIDILPPQLRRKIRSLAVKKGKPVDAFLPWLLKEIDEASQEKAASGHRLRFELRVNQIPANESDFTRRLFTFLFGPLLRQIIDEAGESSRFEIHCDQELLDCKKITLNDLNDLSDKNVTLWPDLEFKFQVRDLNDGIHLNQVQNLKWNPSGLDMLKAFFICSGDPVASAVLAWKTNDSIYDWLRSLTNANVTCSAHSISDYNKAVSPSKSCGESGAKWAEARKEFLDQISVQGLSANACRDFFVKWSSEELLQTANKTEFDLRGTPRDEFNLFMRFDTVDIMEGLAVLPSHPLKVRWIGEYLTEMKSNILTAMSWKGLDLAEGNREFFFNGLKELSPVQHPPYFVARETDEKIYHSIAEYGWGELYKAIESDSEMGIEEVDSSGVDAIAHESHLFVSHHSFKKNGTDVLIVLDRPSHFPEQFLQKFYRGRIKSDSPKLRLHILAKPEVLSKLEILRKQEGSIFEYAEEYQMSPFVDITAYQWDDPEVLPKTIENYSMDLAIIPALFSSKIEKQELNASNPDCDSAAYNPLYSKPVRPRYSEHGENASIILLPESQDETLYAWSNLAVRLSRNESMTTPMSGTDYLSLVIKLHRASKLMGRLHKASLWVVTLDKYLSRSNVENLSCKPEIISFKSNVGKNGSYNLIISADMAQRFIKPRLVNKLGFLNRKYFSSSLIVDELEQIADALFEDSKGLAPSVVLRSLGGGWTINELMGLVCSKRFLDGKNRKADQLSVWIPLDHNVHWFGGATSKKRADLLWVTGNYLDDKLHLAFEVVESKFGKKDLTKKGRKQVRESFDAIKSAFEGECTDSEESSNADARVWRQSLVQSIHSSGVCEGEAFEEGLLGSNFQDDILTGNYMMVTETPRVLCHCPEDVEETSVEEIDGILQNLLDADSILDLLRDRKPSESPPESSPESLDEEDDSSQPEDTITTGSLPEDELDSSGQERESQVEQDDGGSSEPSVDDKVPETDQESKDDEQLPDEIPADEILEDPSGDDSESQEESDEKSTVSAEPEEDDGTPMKFSSIPEEQKIGMYEKLITHLKEQVDSTIRAAKPELGEGEGIVEGPSAIRFQIRYDKFVKSRKIESQAVDIASLFMLAEGLEVNVYRDGPYWVLLPKVTLDPVIGSELQRRFVAQRNAGEHQSGLVVPLGIDSKGEVSSINMASSVSPHLLIAGQTGGGKSVAVKTFIRGCINNFDEDEVELALIDPKGDYKPFSTLSHFGNRYYSQDRKNEWKDILEHAVNLIHERIAIITEAGVTMEIKAYNKEFPEKKMPRFVLIIDECHNVMLDPEDKQNKSEVASIRKIGREGRALGVHMVLSTQRPSAKVIDGEIKANVPAVIGLKVKNDLNSRIIIDQTGAEKLMGNGDAIFRSGNGLITRMQVAIFEEDMV